LTPLLNQVVQTFSKQSKTAEKTQALLITTGNCELTIMCDGEELTWWCSASFQAEAAITQQCLAKAHN